MEQKKAGQIKEMGNVKFQNLKIEMPEKQYFKWKVFIERRYCTEGGSIKKSFSDFAQRPAFTRRWPGAVSKEDSNTRNGLFQAILWKPGQCPQASQIQPRNDEDLASARAEGANLLAPEGVNAVGRSHWVKSVTLWKS